MKGIGTILSITVLFFLLISVNALAHCPVCTLAVGTGVAAARWYGVDSTIVGLWVGAFIISTALWLAGFVERRGWISGSIWQKVAISVGVFISFAVPFYFSGLIGNPAYTVLGVDKLLVGMVTGSVLSYFGPWISNWLKGKNNGNVYIPFQGAAIVLTLLTSSSVFLWWYL